MPAPGRLAATYIARTHSLTLDMLAKDLLRHLSFTWLGPLKANDDKYGANADPLRLGTRESVPAPGP